MKILVIAAHPDDEVLGMGGTINKLSKNNTIDLVVVSEGVSAQYSDKKMMEVRKNACISSGKILGIRNFHFLGFPDMKLDSISQFDINRKLEKIVKKTKPEIIFTTPFHDLNKDHKVVFESTLVATRPINSSVKQIFCYELPGFSVNPFQPNCYYNIEKEFNKKINAFKKYKSEIKKFPHPRSVKSIESLSTLRGVQSGLKRAEAFHLVRSIKI